MRTKIQKWGNSLGLRIPSSFAKEAGVAAGSSVDLSVQDGELVVRPVRQRYALEDLVGGITRSNRHGEIETDDPVGKERW